jgi:hypothetical protein
MVMVNILKFLYYGTENGATSMQVAKNLYRLRYDVTGLTA